VIEMAAASGLVLVPARERDPRKTTTRGTGELLLAALGSGATRVILGIGGSATNDGGAGMAQALGYHLVDDGGHELNPGGSALARLSRIDRGRANSLEGLELCVACDVDNPLCGPRGASAVYGPQKGATPEIVAELDAALAHFADIVERDLGVAIRDLPGAGAAGGLGAGLIAFAGGRLERGIELVIEAVGLEGRLERADLCLTGEGALDQSSAFGKTAVGVARLARRLGCTTIALAGSIESGAERTLEEGLAAYFSICPGPISLVEAINRAGELLQQTTRQAVRAFLAGRHAR
jgi:glycerate kinase